MKERLNVILVTKDETTAKTVGTVVKASEDLAVADVCRELFEVRPYLAHSAAQALIVDIDPDPSGLLHELDMVVTAYPEARVVVISNKHSKKLILAAMQAGARHLLSKKSIPAELVEVLRHLISNGAKHREMLGSIITVLSAGGGCGATTVALNLANELRIASAESVLAVDLDACYGTVSAYLGITGRYGIADVLAHEGLIDKELIKSSTSNYMGDFHVLASPAGIEAPRSKSLQYDNLTHVLQACRQVYRYTVIDAPRVDEDVSKTLAALSKIVLVVFQLTVKDIKFAQHMISSLTASGIPREKIVPLANRFTKRSALVRLEDGQKAIGLASVHHIRSDWRNATNCSNRGRPLAEIAPRSGLRRDFRKLAAEIYS